ncbi:MAG: acetyl-CoA carboxylase biotin carboxylase subunit, partial [Acidobacteriota bacterium]|nr:acetyl-CoA carboxylase biotin carboxylase subunit [Acidobacteriota bacterium]
MNSTSFRKILIANRGEIALRVMRTCRAMGIATVAVYSDADVNALHVLAADEAVHIGAPPAKDSYLNAEKIIEAAMLTSADAIHPGYGFLSENAEFAEACAAAGIVFIGPRAEAIRKMGLKSPARKLAAEAGAPIVLGYDGEEQADETLHAEILRIGFPVLIKASAGGGGKGMHIVHSESEIAEAIESARREAEKAFGNGELLLEKFIERARHVEVQIFGDAHGNLVHLFERDCSLQRRHQKIIEESPSPAVSEELRARMGEAAINIARTINYTNAGTVEFILAPNGEFYFIEVNTRLQVEHPVTEMVTGLDLVKLQIEIAEGKPLPFAQSDLKTSGHAVEVRLYAEDPANNFLPATGTIHDWHLPEDIEGLRIDTGVEHGSEVGIHYDPLLAKLIVHAGDRQTAIRKLSYALRQASIQGVQSNQEFLIRVIEHEGFLTGEAHTGFIAEHLSELVSTADEHLDRASLIAVALYLLQSWQTACPVLSEVPPGYRNNPYRNPSIKLQSGQQQTEVSWRPIATNRFEVQAMGASITVEIVGCQRGQLRLVVDSVQRAFRIIEIGDRLYVHSSLGSRTVIRLPRHPLPRSAKEQGAASSPMPGQVLKILVSEGQHVAAGDALLILEAMKMEQTIRAAADGVVEAIKVTTGQIVSPGDVLVQ